MNANMLDAMGSKPQKSGAIILQEFVDQELNGQVKRHDTFEVVFISRGRGRWQVGCSTGSFQPGTLMLIPPQMDHAWTNLGVEKASGLALRFRRDALPRGVLELEETGALRRLMEEGESGLSFQVPDRERLVARLRSIERAKGVLRLARLYVALELIESYRRVLVVDMETNKAGLTPREIARFEVAKRFIESRFLEPLTRAEVASHVGLEEASFSRFFRKASGASFNVYLSNRRVREAAKWLGNRRDLSLEVVARSSGFRNLGSFHKQFKRALGTTPQAYRNGQNAEALAP